MSSDVMVPSATTYAALGPRPAGLAGSSVMDSVGATPGAGDWKVALLTALGAPPSPANLKALELWHTSEGTSLSTNNWLAISDGANRWPHGACLAQCGGNSPIYAFPSQAVGVQATAAFLHGSYYTAVVNAFRQNQGMASIFQAINQSKWCSGCQSGHYPIALYQGLNGPLTLTPGTPGAPSSGSTGGATTVPISSAGANDCMIGNITMPGPVPNVPCLFYYSWGWAMVGGLALVAGGVVVMVGGILLATKANTVRQALGMVGGPVTRAAGAATSAGSRSGSVSRGGSVRPLQTADQVEENNFLLAQQREVEGRDRNATRRAANAARGRSVPTGYSPRRGPRTARQSPPVTVEGPF